MIKRFPPSPRSKINNFKFGLNNFKSFKEVQYIEISPLTIICGINNCGKSSIIQSILLLSQSLTTSISIDKLRIPIRIPKYFIFPGRFGLEDVKYKISLLFEGKFCHLSDFNNVVNKYSEVREFSIYFNFENIQCIFTFFNPQEKDTLEAYIKSIEIKGEKYSLIFNSNLDEKNQIINYSCRINELSLGALFYFARLGIFLSRKEEKFIEKFKDLSIENLKILNLQITFEDFIPVTAYLPREKFKGEIENIFKEFVKKNEEINEILNKIFKKIEKEEKEEEMEEKYKRKRYRENYVRFLRLYSEFIHISKFLTTIHYIGPLRDEPHRYYQFFDIRKLIIGNKGEFTSQILSLERDIKIPSFNIINIKNNTFKMEEHKNLTLKEGLLKWAQYLDLPDIDPKRVEQILVKIMVNLPKIDKPVTLQDVGFGISQILPVYIESLRMEKDHTLILEQPEIHLHPNMQSKLADFLLSMTVSGKRFIIETHSEHLINRLCLRIAQDQTNKLKDLITFVFIEPPKEDKEKGFHGSLIKDINLNKYGEIENWPIGFFDETDHPHILMAGIDKKKMEKAEK